MKKILYSIVALLSLVVLVFSAKVNAVEVQKEGTTLKVTNPKVTVTGDASDIYGRWGLTFQVDFPDEVTINENDTLQFNLKAPIRLQSDYSFPVYNKANQVVANAKVNAAEGTVTVTFSSYFEENYLKKNMELSVEVFWASDDSLADTTQELDFNGTVITQKIKPLPMPGPNEMAAKWGAQQADNAEQVHWWARLNYARKTLSNIEIKDVWDANQTYVPGSLRVELVESTYPWKSAGYLSESDYEITPTGITVKINSTDKIIFIDYKVQLANPSKNPQNRITITAEELDDAISTDVTYKMLTGIGLADGEKPVTTTATTTTTTTTSTTETTTTATTTTESTTTEVTTVTTTTEEPTTEGTTTTTVTPQTTTTEEPKRPELPNTGTLENPFILVFGALAAIAGSFLVFRKQEA